MKVYWGDNRWTLQECSLMVFVAASMADDGFYRDITTSATIELEEPDRRVEAIIQGNYDTLFVLALDQSDQPSIHYYIGALDAV